jgi:TM2 domain-containing membrane protein YozV
MRGTVLSYNGNAGLISGDDGQRYQFVRDDLGAGSHSVSKGTIVDFEPSSDGFARNIFVITPSFDREKNKWVAVILCFLLGWLGIHKFYLNKTSAGIAMLVLATLGWILIIPPFVIAFISFIELIIYLLKSEQSFYEDYVIGNREWF